MDRILAILPVHNREATTRSALCSLRAAQRSRFKLDVLVINDGSTDGTASMVAGEFPEVMMIHGDGNLWWGGALNVGFRYALESNYQFVYAMNDDVNLQPNTILELYEAAVLHPSAVCGSVVLYETGEVLSADFGFRGPLKKVRSLSNGLPITALKDEILESETLSTRSTLIPNDILKKNLFVDEKRFPHHFSDYDYFDTVRRAGFKVLVVVRSVVVSDMSSSSFHRLIASSDIRAIFLTFTSIKYSNNFKTQWQMASRYSSPLWTLVRFIGFMSPYVYWASVRCILPRRRLIQLLSIMDRHPMLGRTTDI